MSPWSIYNLATGLFTGDQVVASETNARLQLRPGLGLKAGEWDPELWRVEGDAVVPYLPPKPADDEHRTWSLSADGRRWIAEPTATALWAEIRADRNRRIAATEWIRSRAADRGEPVPQAWLDYWQALRDITNQADPRAIAWPEPPKG